MIYTLVASVYLGGGFEHIDHICRSQIPPGIKIPPNNQLFQGLKNYQLTVSMMCPHLLFLINVCINRYLKVGFIKHGTCPSTSGIYIYIYNYHSMTSYIYIYIYICILIYQSSLSNYNTTDLHKTSGTSFTLQNQFAARPWHVVWIFWATLTPQAQFLMFNTF